jgi:predicted phosphodiesterase
MVGPVVRSLNIAVVADIHGNLPALRRIAADIARRGIATVINLGDHASGPLWPSETVEFLMAQPWTHIAGNCDRQLTTQPPPALGPSDRFAFDRLTAAQRQWMAGLPPKSTATNGVHAFHGTPGDDSSYLLETVEGGSVRLARPSEIEHRLDGVTGDVLLCAHSHIPRVVRLGATLIVNPGSVGLPAYESDGAPPHFMETGSPDARYAILERDRGAWSVELLSVPYDHESAADLAERNGRADWARALRTGLAACM